MNVLYLSDPSAKSLSDPSAKSLLPSPDTIYYKDFHFLDEPLIHRRYPSHQKTA